MATEHGDRAVREAPLSLIPDEPAEPEQYGLRVNWQSDEVKIEAAEFLVATRVQQDARIRAAHDLELLRATED
ncbi:MAG: hypothetical protein LH461_01105 [Spirochaetaceae bacterium]|nr:hypothetical protein [Spirochaetaceae bacterium]